MSVAIKRRKSSIRRNKWMNCQSIQAKLRQNRVLKFPKIQNYIDQIHLESDSIRVLVILGGFLDNCYGFSGQIWGFFIAGFTSSTNGFNIIFFNKIFPTLSRFHSSSTWRFRILGGFSSDFYRFFVILGDSSGLLRIHQISFTQLIEHNW